MSFASVNGIRVTKGVITIPSFGIWHADLYLQDASDLAGALTVTLGDLTMKGSIFRAASFSGARSVRVVGGAGGWRKTLKPKSYRADAGLRLSLVAKDAAREVGESVTILEDKTIGFRFVRPSQVAAMVLDQLVPVWWMGFDGVTVLGARPNSRVLVPMVPIGYSGAAGRVDIAADSYAPFVPAATFSTSTTGTRTISSVIHHLDGDSTRTELLVSP